jgi:hypothetical protein
MQPNLVLLFVYAIDRGSLSAVTDYHRSTGPARTPRCALYSLIITPVGMKKGWKRVLADFVIPSRFLHLDEFQQEFSIQDPVAPAVFIQNGKAIHQLVTAEEINRIQSTDQLAELVKKRLMQYFR